MATVKAKIEFNGEEYDLSVEDIEGILFNVKEIIRMLNLNDITRCYSNDRYEIYIVANSHYYIQIDKSTFKVLVITYKKFCKIFKQFNDWNIERYNNLFGSSIDERIKYFEAIYDDFVEIMNRLEETIKREQEDEILRLILGLL